MPPRAPMTGPERPTLIYDGECGMCRALVARLAVWDREHRIALVPFQDEAVVTRFGIGLPALAAAMHLVLPDGRVSAGADAGPELLRRTHEALVATGVRGAGGAAAGAARVPL